MIDEQVEKAVAEAKSPSKFNIVEFVKNRAYPTDEVVIYLNEDVAYKAARLKERIEELSKGGIETQDELDSLIVKRDAAIVELNKSKYIFHLTGISEGKRDELIVLAQEKFPLEYEEDKNPFTGETKKKEVDSKERDRYFTLLLWENCITKVVSPDGEEQFDLEFSDIEVLRDSLPLASVGAITNAVDRLRLSTAVFLMEVDNEDFLAKP